MSCKKKKKKPEESGDSDPPRDESVREEKKKKKKRVVCVCGGGVCDVCAQSKLRADSHIPSRKEEKERTTTKYQREYEWLKNREVIFRFFYQAYRVGESTARRPAGLFWFSSRSGDPCVCVWPASLLTVSVVAYSM